MKTRLLGLMLLTALGGGHPSQGVILAGGDGTQNATGVGAGAGWNYVGVAGAASAVYLGSYGGHQWVITGWHVGVNQFTLSGTTYNAVSGSGIRIQNANGTDTDLLVYRISGDPGLSNLQIASSAPVVGSSLTLIGAGRNRATAMSYWDVTGTVWTEQGSEVGAEASGYNWAAGRTLRWGTNTLEAFAPFNSGNGPVAGFYTDFDNEVGEAQGSIGDSGGGVFYDTGSGWELAGLMLAVAGYTGQPSEASIFGGLTYSADLSQYRNQILTAIPEPSTYALLGMAALVLAGCVGVRRGKALGSRADGHNVR